MIWQEITNCRKTRLNFAHVILIYSYNSMRNQYKTNSKIYQHEATKNKLWICFFL